MQATAADRAVQHLGGQLRGSDDEELVVLVPEREEMAIEQPMKGWCQRYPIRKVVRSELGLAGPSDVCGFNQAVYPVRR